MEKLNSYDKIIKAKKAMLFEQPFFATQLFRLKLIEDNTCKTGWTNGIELGYNSNFIKKLTFNVLKSFLVHEVLHNALLHPFRLIEMKVSDMKLFNVAADFVVNLIIVDSGMEIGKDWLYDVKYKGLNVEQVYRLLKSDQQKKDQVLNRNLMNLDYFLRQLHKSVVEFEYRPKIKIFVMHRLCFQLLLII